jgi:hypothetical protein
LSLLLQLHNLLLSLLLVLELLFPLLFELQRVLLLGLELVNHLLLRAWLHGI